MKVEAPKKAPQDNLKEPWKKGESGNPKGYKKGQKNFSTIYKEAMKRMANARNMTPEELELVLHEVGLDKALKGNEKFYHQMLDRIHGKPNASLDIGNTDGEPFKQSISVSWE